PRVVPGNHPRQTFTCPKRIQFDPSKDVHQQKGMRAYFRKILFGSWSLAATGDRRLRQHPIKSLSECVSAGFWMHLIVVEVKVQLAVAILFGSGERRF
ncbi:MAG: hypothetical protein AAGG44_09680, partial [Planctomycetota bacterium]